MTISATPQEFPGRLEPVRTRFPVFLVSWMFVWCGVISLVDAQLDIIGDAGGALIAPHSAIVFSLMGVAMLIALERPKLSRLFAAGSLLLSVILYVSGWEAVPHPGAAPPLHVAGSWTLLLIAQSVALLCCGMGQRGRLLARVLGATVIVGSVAFRFSPYWELSDPSTATDTANLGLILGVSAGAAVFALSLRRDKLSAFSPRMVAIMGMVGTLFSVMAWYALTVEDRKMASNHAEALTDRLIYALEKSIHEQQARLQRMASRWNAVVMPSRSLVDAELSGYLGDAPTVNMVAVLNAKRKIHWIDGEPDATAWVREALQGSDLHAWLDHIHEAREVHFTASDADESGAIRALTAAPLSSPLLKGWTILTVHDLPTLLSLALATAQSSIVFQLAEGDRVLYGGATRGEPARLISERQINLHHDLQWTLTAWDGRAWLNPLADPMPDVVLLLCLMFTYFLTRSQRLANALTQRSAQLYYGSMHDTSTGLPNRRHLMRTLHEFFHDLPPDHGLAVVLVDLHGLRLINDSMGHDVGDKVLVLAAARLRANVRNGFVARMANDEFVIVLRGLPFSVVVTAAERLIDALAQPYAVHGTELRLSSNAGIALRDESTFGPIQLLREADLAVIRARRDGRNTWQQYSAGLDAEVTERLHMRNELQRAIEEDAFRVHYQPVMDGRNGRIIGIEALLRWRHQEKGEIAPSLFVPIAEETGLIIPLSDWILDRACRDLARLRSDHDNDLVMMVNISPLHFQRSEFMDTVSACLRRHSVPAACLELEITEGVLLDHTEQIISKLVQLKALGVKLSLDDFGTGYSSLNYLKNLPIDKLKIDRSFVSEVISDANAAAITQSVITLAHHLDVKVVAEGVETDAQFCFLQRHACDEFQGFLIAHPMPLDELEQFLREAANAPPSSDMMKTWNLIRVPAHEAIETSLPT